MFFYCKEQMLSIYLFVKTLLCFSWRSYTQFYTRHSQLFDCTMFSQLGLLNLAGVMKPLQTKHKAKMDLYSGLVELSRRFCLQALYCCGCHCSSITSGGCTVNRLNQHNPAKLPLDKTFFILQEEVVGLVLTSQYSSAVCEQTPCFSHICVDWSKSCKSVLMCSWQRIYIF